jgi:hypothetical protein
LFESLPQAESASAKTPAIAIAAICLPRRMARE